MSKNDEMENRLKEQVRTKAIELINKSKFAESGRDGKFNPGDFSGMFPTVYSQPLPPEALGINIPSIAEAKVLASLPAGVSTIPGGFDPKNLTWVGGQNMKYSVRSKPTEWQLNNDEVVSITKPSSPEKSQWLNSTQVKMEKGEVPVSLRLLDNWKEQLVSVCSQNTAKEPERMARQHFKLVNSETYHQINNLETNFHIVLNIPEGFAVGDKLVVITTGAEPLHCLIKSVTNYALAKDHVILVLEKLSSRTAASEKEVPRIDVGDAVSVHYLKSDPDVFQAVFDGRQTFEIRYDDRNYQVGDVLILRETVYTGKEMAGGAELVYTTRHLTRRVTYKLSGYGLDEGWVILGTVKEEKDED